MTFQMSQDSQRDDTRSRQEQEEKLILTAWKSMVRSQGKKILVTLPLKTFILYEARVYQYIQVCCITL